MTLAPGAGIAEQRWDPERYRRNAAFVPALGQGVLELLAARPGERILDLGCGDGTLTAILAATSEVVGVDARERSQKARGPVHLRAASTCHRRPTYGLVDLRAASTHGLAMAPRHEEPVEGILDQAEIRTALLTRHGPLAAPP